MARRRAHNHRVLGTSAGDWRTRLAAKSPKYVPPSSGAAPSSAGGEPVSLSRLNELKQQIMAARIAEDADEVIRLWQAADAVAKGLGEQGVRPIRDRMDACYGWAIRRR